MAIRVQSIGVGSGTSSDLTDQVVGLSWSSVNPGGDERATFQLKRQWFAGAPEIQQGNLLRISDGPQVLWVGRVEENDRAVSDSEYIGVTAYGLGVRLKDTTMIERYVDRDPANWSDAPYNRKAALFTAGTPYSLGDFTWSQDAGGLVCALPNQALPARTAAEAWYTAPQGVTIAKVMYKGTTTSLPASWTYRLLSTTTDAAAASTNLAATFDDTLRSLTPTAARYLFLQVDANGVAATPASGANARVSVIATYGNHGLTTRAIDASTPDGLYVEDVISNAVGRASGITVQRLDASGVTLPHFTVDTPTTLEDVVTQANQYAGFDWGTFGPSSPLDSSTNGYFCFKARDTSTAHWYAHRSDCDDISLQVELATLYNAVDVIYTDPTTTGNQIVTRTATVQALTDAGITRKAALNGGTLTTAGAQTLGDAFLALTSQQAPARGSVQLSTYPTHYQRGKLPAHFMRADGSNLRIPDVLPSKDALSLSSTPDRRTTFPVKRVSVDCSGQKPVTTVEVDQTNDRLSVLQARLGLAAQYPGAWPITLPR